jgi:hypothetical protein
MSPLLTEIGLRLAKAGAALVVAIVVWLVAVGPLGAEATAELGLLCWLAGAAFILLVETSPI